MLRRALPMYIEQLFNVFHIENMHFFMRQYSFIVATLLNTSAVLAKIPFSLDTAFSNFSFTLHLW